MSRQRVDEAAGSLAQHVGAGAADHLAGLPHQRVAAVNRMLAAMADPHTVAPGPELLTAVAREEAPGVWRLLDTRPQVPLSQPALVTTSHSAPKLGSELRSRLATADRVDLLCALVKWYSVGCSRPSSRSGLSAVSRCGS